MMAALAAVEGVALVGCRHTQCATAAVGLVPGVWRHATRCGGMRPGVEACDQVWCSRGWRGPKAGPLPQPPVKTAAAAPGKVRMY